MKKQINHREQISHKYLVLRNAGLFIIISAFVMLGCGRESAGSWLSIYNGTPANDKWPSAVALLRDGSTFCSGSLVHPRVVITAAHCLENINRAMLKYYEVRTGFGGPYSSKDENHYGIQDYNYIKDFRLAQEFSATQFNRDVGYVLLMEPISDVEITPLLLDLDEKEQALKIGNSITLVGFGANEKGHIGSKLETQNIIYSFEKNIEVEVGPDGELEQGACRGDSGGPAYVQLDSGEWRVFGISSRGDANCIRESIYGLMNANICWIESRTGLEIAPNNRCRTIESFRERNRELWLNECMTPSTPEIDYNFKILKQFVNSVDCAALERYINENPNSRMSGLGLTDLWPILAIKTDTGRFLHFSDNNISDLDFLNFIEGNFISLDLARNQITEIMLPPKQFDIYSYIYLQENNLSQLPDLKNENIINIDLSSNSFTEIPYQLPAIMRGLKVSDNMINDLTNIEKYTNLESLSIDNNPIASIDSLKILSPKLVGIDISNTNVSNITPLESADNLISFQGNYSKISDLSPLKGKNKLSRVEINNGSAEGVLDLKDSTRLAYLSATDNRLTNVILPENADKLSEINLKNNNIEEINGLNKKIINLDLSVNRLKNLFFIQDGMAFNRLDISGNEDINDFEPLLRARYYVSLKLPYIPGILDESSQVIHEIKKRDPNLEIRFLKLWSTKDIHESLLNRFPGLKNKPLTESEAYYILGFDRITTTVAVRSINLVLSIETLEAIFQQVFEPYEDNQFILRRSFENIELKKFMEPINIKE